MFDFSLCVFSFYSCGCFGLCLITFSQFILTRPCVIPLSINFGVLFLGTFYSNGGGYSVTSSSAGGQSQNQYSAAASGETETSLFGGLLPTPSLKVYSFSDMKNATKSFKSDTVLGVGGFGTVYKGWVDEKTLAPSKVGTGMMVAIKKLNHESVQGFREWQVRFCGTSLFCCNLFGRTLPCGMNWVLRSKEMLVFFHSSL